MPLLQRLAEVFAASPANPATAMLYQSCVTQARAEAFYRDLAVPDTIDGRFDLLVLHVYLVIRRMGAAMEAKQQLFDLMFADMDQSLREMGVGDMGVPKRMKRMIGAFYGRAQAYEKALGESDVVLAETLARNLYGKITPPPAALQAMTAYVRRVIAKLDTQSTKDILAGRVDFLSPNGGEDTKT